MAEEGQAGPGGGGGGGGGGDQQSDLSLQSRSRLIQAGFEALAKKKPRDALAFFGAAIRKARRVKLCDIEAEYYKFVVLYLEGDFPEAVQRCLECLDGIKMFRDAVEAEGKGGQFTFEKIVVTLEDCLAQTMIMRRDSLFTLIGHFWQLQYGEYYLLKKRHGFLGACFRAWQVTALSLPINFNLLKEELKPFSGFLQGALDKGDEEEELNRASKKSELQQVKDVAKKTVEEKKTSGESKSEAFLASAGSKGFMSLSDAELELLKEICASTKSHKNLVEIRRLIDVLGPNSKKPYLMALSKNPIFSGLDSRVMRDRELSLLYQDIQAAKDSRIGEEAGAE